MVAANGDLTERYEYTPYGQRTIFSRGWLLADMNDNGAVDMGDYTIWAAEYGTGDPDSRADLNGNGEVDLGDHTIWSTSYANGDSIAADDPLVMRPRLESFRSPLYTGAGISLCDVGHQGLMHDKEFGLIYNRARYLDPVLGRFTGRDPMEYIDGMNLYEYVRSNTVRYVDPMGLERGPVGSLGPNGVERKWRQEFEIKHQRTKYMDGVLNVWTEELNSAKGKLGMKVTLTRPHDKNENKRGTKETGGNKEFREFWNTRTRFPRLRKDDPLNIYGQTDRGDEWVWPNLPLLLNAHGGSEEVDPDDRKRVKRSPGRYGGWFPKTKTDDDFMAVVIRKYHNYSSRQHKGTYTEHEDTVGQQAVISANWHGTDDGNPYAVVHAAVSDAFHLHLTENAVNGKKPCFGRAKIWVVYLDMEKDALYRDKGGRRLVEGAAGGSVAYFEVNWKYPSGKHFDAYVQWVPPPSKNQDIGLTGMNWAKWVGRYKISSPVKAKAKLIDRQD